MNFIFLLLQIPMWLYTQKYHTKKALSCKDISWVDGLKIWFCFPLNYLFSLIILFISYTRNMHMTVLESRLSFEP